MIRTAVRALLLALRRRESNWGRVGANRIEYKTIWEATNKIMFSCCTSFRTFSWHSQSSFSPLSNCGDTWLHSPPLTYEILVTCDESLEVKWTLVTTPLFEEVAHWIGGGICGGPTSLCRSWLQVLRCGMVPGGESSSPQLEIVHPFSKICLILL